MVRAWHATVLMCQLRLSLYHTDALRGSLLAGVHHNFLLNTIEDFMLVSAGETVYDSDVTSGQSLVSPSSYQCCEGMYS